MCLFKSQSMLPVRGATRVAHAAALGAAISIHTPHKGSDMNANDTQTITFEFQSTLPARGAT